jgi:flagellar motor protein MotB
MAMAEAEEGGEGYFASISDLMVGILFVFLLMLTIFALNYRETEDDQQVAKARLEAAEAALKKETERAEQKAREAEEAEKRARAEEERARLAQVAANAQRLRNQELRQLLQQAFISLRQELEGRQRARQRLLDNLRDRLKERGLTVEINPETGTLRLPEDLLFNTGQSELGHVSGRGLVPSERERAIENLAKLAATLAETLPCFTHMTSAAGCNDADRGTLDGVLVEGHSDRQGYRIGGRQLSPEESRDRNDKLSMERALTVFRELRQRNGLDDLRNSGNLPLLAVSAYGERRPIAPGDTEEDFRRNRRIDLRFILSTRTSDDLQRLVERIGSNLEAEP